MNYKVYSDHIEFFEADGIFRRKVLGLPASISISISISIVSGWGTQIDGCGALMAGSRC